MPAPISLHHALIWQGMHTVHAHAQVWTVQTPGCLFTSHCRCAAVACTAGRPALCHLPVPVASAQNKRGVLPMPVPCSSQGRAKATIHNLPLQQGVVSTCVMRPAQVIDSSAISCYALHPGGPTPPQHTQRVACWVGHTAFVLQMSFLPTHHLSTQALHRCVCAHMQLLASSGSQQERQA